MTDDTHAERREKVILKLPQIKIGPTDGFDEKDWFSYKRFGSSVANVFRDSDGLNVALLDDDWGMGKTTFALQWAGLMRNLGHRVIYIDAFANDFHQDPFLMLVSEIKDAFPEQAKNLVENAIKIGGAIGLKMASGGLISREEIEKSIKDHLSKAKENKEIAKKFKNNLEKLAGDKEKPMIIIIDELDRCRPDFALRLLERIKHFFSVDGISFLLVANMKQLSAMAEHSYGFGPDGARVYLEKFYDVHLRLPDETEEMRGMHGRYKTRMEKYVKYLSERMKVGDEHSSGSSLQRVQLMKLMGGMAFSLRNVEKIATHIALITAGRIGERSAVLPSLIAGLLVIRIQDPNLYKDILRMSENIPRRNISGLNMHELLQRVKSALLLDRVDENFYPDMFFKVCWLYVLGKKMKKDGDAVDRDAVDDVNKGFNGDLYTRLGIYGNRENMEFEILPSIARQIDGLLGM